jgi:hypothetical protein
MNWSPVRFGAVQTPGVRGNPHTTFSSGRNGKAAEIRNGQFSIFNCQL